MTITIELNNQEDFEWLQPFLEKLASKSSVQLSYSFKEKKQNVTRFLSFVHKNPLKVSNLTIPNREQRNER